MIISFLSKQGVCLAVGYVCSFWTLHNLQMIMTFICKFFTIHVSRRGPAPVIRSGGDAKVHTPANLDTHP